MRITDKHYNAIGRVSVSFSDVEIWISGFIWRLISQDFHIGQMITAEMSFSRQLIPLLCSLFRYRVSDNIKFDKFNKLINRLSKIAEDRDHLIHSNWLVESPNISSVT